MVNHDGKLVAMLGLLSKPIRQSGRLRGNDPQRALCHPTILREASSSGAQIRNDTREDMEQTLHLQAQGLDWICRDHSGSNRLSLRCGWALRKRGYAHPRHAGLGLHARQRRKTRLRKLKGTEHLAKVIADVQFYNGERGESLPETMMSNATNENDFVLSPKC